jgi:hypothetical protein
MHALSNSGCTTTGYRTNERWIRHDQLCSKLCARAGGADGSLQLCSFNERAVSQIMRSKELDCTIQCKSSSCQYWCTMRHDQLMSWTAQYNARAARASIGVQSPAGLLNRPNEGHYTCTHLTCSRKGCSCSTILVHILPARGRAVAAAHHHRQDSTRG